MSAETVSKPEHGHAEILPKSNAHDAAEQGQVATDAYGNSLVQFDPVAERRLRTKIDWYIVPTVSLLYLFCFIDRANIGESLSPRTSGLVI
ncbi:hypothetical protein LOZ03_006798 [Ophidiomyces ophidiicola]|nr:hypothetical protein LOZ03_006798 [Ophidiomyces ophidiicola]